ncbi:MAG: PD-(D/E)XK nuclease family protein [Treponema sp.]|nr:PD-(D/E)XK nuclease family protein [Treponema sp.]
MTDNEDKTIKGKIEELKTNAAFQMSLSGKELFHSNMIAMFLTQKEYPDLSEEMIKLFPPKTGNVKREDLFVFDVIREKQHLDFIICYCDKQYKENLEVYSCVDDVDDDKDLSDTTKEALKNMQYVVVENKFKSFPYKEQLNEYSDKKPFSILKNVKCTVDMGQNTTCYLLAPNASLKTFYAKDEYNYVYTNINGRNISWEGIKYEKLKSTLENWAKKNESDNLTIFPQFITEYCVFLGKMLEIYKKCVEDRLKKQKCFLETTDNKYLLKGRIQDFYEKSIFNRILAKLREEIPENTPTNNKVFINNNTNLYFVSNAGFMRKTGYLDFRYIWENSYITAGIQIQDSAFEIVFSAEEKPYGISRNSSKAKKESISSFKKKKEIPNTIKCIETIYKRIKEEYCNRYHFSLDEFPKLHYKNENKKNKKPTVYSFQTSKYTFRYLLFSLNDLTGEKDYREIKYDKLKELIKISLDIIKEKCYEDLKKELKSINN